MVNSSGVTSMPSKVSAPSYATCVVGIILFEVVSLCIRLYKLWLESSCDAVLLYPEKILEQGICSNGQGSGPVFSPNHGSFLYGGKFPCIDGGFRSFVFPHALEVRSL